MLADRYGCFLSTSSAVARDAYVDAVDCILSAVDGHEAHLARALDADPGFALAHVALARSLFQVGMVAPARAAAGRARELVAAATPREQAHVDAIALAIEGKAADALDATRRHLAEHPRDAMALAPATGVFGLIGFSGRQQREQELLELLRTLAPHYGDDWWFLCVLAFATSECGLLEEAAELIERSMQGNPRNAHGAHIKVHVLYEMGKGRQALDYLDAWMPDYNRQGLLHCHLSWHVALFALDLGETDRAWDVYRASVHPGGSWGPPLNVATDAPSFLWRSELAGQQRHSGLWRDTRDYLAASFPQTGVVFVDVHRALAFAATGEFAAIEQVAAELRDRQAAGKLPAGGVVETLVHAFASFARKDWGAAIAALERGLAETVRIGGSRAQRDLVDNTLVAAYLAAGRAADARRLIAQRTDRRPTVQVAGFPG